jgi:uncharacterized membrane protein
MPGEDMTRTERTHSKGAVITSQNIGLGFGASVGRGVAVAVAAVLIAGVASRSVAHASSDKAESLVYAVYPGENTAGDVYKKMVKSQRETGERIEAYAVVSKDLKGNVRVHDQRKTDAGVGAVVGGVVGLLGGPVTAAITAVAGGAFGYLTGDAVGIAREKVEEMRASLTPDSSALVVVLEDRWMQDFERGLKQADARAVIASQIMSGTTTSTSK